MKQTFPKWLSGHWRFPAKMLAATAILLTGTAVTSKAQQVAWYSFSQSNGAYVPITGGTVVGQATNADPTSSPESAPMDDYTYENVAIPFSFTFNGTAYTALNINTNGWVSFGATTSSSSNPISSSNSYTGVISPFGRDLAGTFATTGDRTNGSNVITNVANTSTCSIGAAIQGAGIPSGTTVTAFTANSITLSAAATATNTAAFLSFTTGEIRVQTLGTAPTRTFVIQFKGMCQYSNSASTTINNTSADFQVRLNEGGGVVATQSIDVVYGNVFRTHTAAGTQTGGVGLRGTSSSDYNCRSSATDWAATVAGTSSSATVTWGGVPSVNPASGLTYTWTPPSCIPPASAASAAVTANSATISWPVPTTVPGSGYEIYNSTSSTAPIATTTPTYPGITGLSQVITGLTPGSPQYVWVRSNCGPASKSIWIAVPSFNTIPANDEASGALPLTVNADLACAVTTTGTTISATQSADGAPSCSATGINDDVWYTFNATSSAVQFAFSSVTTGTMAVALYTGTPGSLTPVTGACNSGSTVDLQGLTPGTTYYARVYTTSSSTSTTTNFTVCVGIPAGMAYVSSTTTQSSSSSLAAGSTNQQIIRTVVVASGMNNALALTQLNYNTTGSNNPASSIVNAKVYYTGSSTTFSTSTQFGTTVVNPNGTFTVNGSQALLGASSGNTNNYFWLVYDINCAATPADSVDAQCTSLVVGGASQTPTATNPSGSRQITAIFATTRSDGNSTTAVTAGSVNAQFAYANVTAPSACASTATSATFTVTGASAATDIALAKCYYTTTSTFSNAVPFGTAIANPVAGTITFTGSQALTAGSNYFWLVYDISCGAGANTINGDVTSLVVNGTTVTPTGSATSGNAINVLLTTTQPTGTVSAGSLNNAVVRVNLNPCGATSTLTGATFNITGTANAADIVSAKAYYTTSTTFSTAIPFGTAVANPNGSFTINGSQAITGAAYLWLAYDVNCAATATNVLDAECTSIVLSGSTFAPATTNPSGTRAITAASYTAAITQASTAVVPQGSNGQLIVYATLAGCANTPVTSITFGTTGTTAVADIAAARVFYTPTSTFANPVQFGTTIAAPGATMTFTGSQQLTTGTGYFWLLYDIAAGATVANVVDGSLTSAVINGVTATPSSTTASGTRSVIAPIVNDNAPGAITLSLGAGCSTASYTNVNAGQDFNEPSGNCTEALSYATVWYKFTAPAGGAVRISTDLGTGNTLSDSRVALFSATDPNNYSTFNLIGCDEDGGTQLGSGYMSVLYATGLTPSTTYYVQVGNFGSSTTSGTFCIAVDELNSSMLSTTNTCTSSFQGVVGSNTAYTGWLNLLDGSSKLIAMVRNTAGLAPSTYTVGQNINTGAVRSDVNGRKYLDRNFRIVNTNAGNYDVQLFILNTEQAALQAADPAATLGGLNITRVTGESGCNNNATGAGTTSAITQSSSGSAGGVSWVNFSTPGFSNFYLMSGTVPLPVTLKSFTGKNAGEVNQLNWETAEEKNFSHFELQRSADGISFSSITEVSADRNSNGSSYAYTDASPFKGINIYRLKMVDLDGKASLSQVVTLDVKGTKHIGVQVYPNPVKQTLSVSISGQPDGRATLQLLDLTGKVIRNISLQGNNAQVDMSQMPSGMYLMKYTDNSHSSVIKITRE